MVMMLVHCVIAVRMLGGCGDPAQAIVMALHTLKHRRRRRIRQGDADQQNEEGAKLFHVAIVALSFLERNVE